jgi:hypothetical protein
VSVFGVVVRIGTVQSFVFYVVTACVIVGAWSGFGGVCYHCVCGRNEWRAGVRLAGVLSESF